VSVQARARDLWNDGRPRDAGRLIFEDLPNDARPKWAAGILRLVLQRSKVKPALFEDVLAMADHPRRWSSGHEMFSRLRKEVLRLENRRISLSESEQQLSYVLALAELVAKVTYNATQPSDEFDEDSGWYIVDILRGLADWWKDDKFAQDAWNAVVSR
jgi:hypothetical protein